MRERKTNRTTPTEWENIRLEPREDSPLARTGWSRWIEDYIPFGRERAIPRAELLRLTGLSDRQLSRELANARRRGVLIVNLQDARGYFQTDDLNDLSCQYWLNQRRALSILSQQRHLRRRLLAAGREV
ncbi:MAG: hypothetical protein KH009_08900 [Clostridiales bacterium]|nr:hypothetical protein [Clostridiales bacterium]